MPDYRVQISRVDDETARVECKCGAEWIVPDTLGVVDAALAHPGVCLGRGPEEVLV